MYEASYLHRRATQERLAATNAETMKVFRAHMDMALAYERRLLAHSVPRSKQLSSRVDRRAGAGDPLFEDRALDRGSSVSFC